MKVGISIDRSVKETEVLITAQEQTENVDALYAAMLPGKMMRPRAVREDEVISHGFVLFT